MKNYTLVVPQPTVDQHVDDKFPNVFRLQHGILYSRWFVLSALFDTVVAILGCICSYIVPGQPLILGIFWHLSNQSVLEQCLLIAGIFILFLLGSIVAFLVGYRFFEASPHTNVRRNRSRVVDFDGLRWLLGINGIIIFTAGLYDWIKNTMPPGPFAFALIFLFLTLWTFCNNRLRKIEKARTSEKYLDLYSARRLFCCLFGVNKIMRPKLDNPATTIPGMKPYLNSNSSASKSKDKV